MEGFDAWAVWRAPTSELPLWMALVADAKEAREDREAQQRDANAVAIRNQIADMLNGD